MPPPFRAGAKVSREKRNSNPDAKPYALGPPAADASTRRVVPGLAFVPERQISMPAASAFPLGAVMQIGDQLAPGSG